MFLFLFLISFTQVKTHRGFVFWAPTQTPGHLQAGGSSTSEIWGCSVQAKKRRRKSEGEAKVTKCVRGFSKNIKKKTNHITETPGSKAASDADVAPDQNLPGPAFIRQVVFVGVRQRLENTEVYFKCSDMDSQPSVFPFIFMSQIWNTSQENIRRWSQDLGSTS